MEKIEKSIEVEAPLRVVYNQWTQFAEFPEFMEGVEEVSQLDDKRMKWKAQVGGKTKEWDAEIFEQVPDERIAWRSTSGTKNSGMVNFEAVDTRHTRITLTLNYEPESTMEKVGDALGLLSLRVSGDLKRFKEFIERRGAETGGWRGSIHGREVHGEAGRGGATTGTTPGMERRTSGPETPLTGTPSTQIPGTGTGGSATGL